MIHRFIRFFFSVTFFSALLVILPGSLRSSASIDSTAGLRWAEVDKGIPSYAYRAGAMLIQKNKISSISQIYGALMFDGTKWNTNTNTSTFPRSDFSGNMFLDSRGITYVGGVRADYDGVTPYSYIFESSDGLNYVPVQQFVDVNGHGIIWNFTEDKYGNVWAGEFTGKTSTTGAHLWRRRPDGTWTNVANWALPEWHIHHVYYDPYRDALYVAIGDNDHGILKLSSDKINADGISASDFSFILPRFPDGSYVEVTAITSDSSYLYVGMDMHTSFGTKTRAIARITDNNVTQTIEAVYPLAGCGIWQWADVDNAGNIIFSSNGINEWNCTNNYVNKIVVSSDHGSTWLVVKDFGSSATSKGLQYTGLASHYSTNWSGLYGGGNGWGGPAHRATIGRIIPANSTFYVDGTNGVDWTNFGISPSSPVKTLNYLELLDIQPGDTVQFVGTNAYTKPLIAGWSGNNTAKILLRGNPFSTFTGGNIANLPAVSETFESSKDLWNFLVNETGGTITADTTVVHSGSHSAKIVRDTGIVYLRLKNVPATNLFEGDTMYMSYWVYYPTDQTSNSDTAMLRLLDDSNYELDVKLFPQGTENLTNELILNVPAWSSYQIPSRHNLTSGTWHKIYIENYLHSTSGSFKLYVDNDLWFNVNGIKTITPGGKLFVAYFYNFEKPITYYIDDFKFGKLPFDARGALNINENSYLDYGGFRIAGTNGVTISSNSNDVVVHDSIFNGLTADAIANYSNANINFYYNTIYGSGRYGLYTAGNATLINNIIYNSTTNDVFIDTGASLTGSHNWFKDSGSGGTGNYIDGGNTTWSGADPGFANLSSGNFNLLPSSPVIDAGIEIAGFTTDFVGTTRPVGLAPDIGALEFSLIYQMFVPLLSK